MYLKYNVPKYVSEPQETPCMKGHTKQDQYHRELENTRVYLEVKQVCSDQMSVLMATRCLTLTISSFITGTGQRGE